MNDFCLGSNVAFYKHILKWIFLFTFLHMDLTQNTVDMTLFTIFIVDGDALNLDIDDVYISSSRVLIYVFVPRFQHNYT